MRFAYGWLIPASIMGLIVGEGLVRIATFPSIDYASLFRPGPYCADRELHIGSACPNWTGFQRMPGEERYTPLALDAIGYRGPYSNSERPDVRQRTVAIIGGQSQQFGFGLQDDETIANVAAHTACGPVKIYNVALVGLRNEIAWHLFERDVLPIEKPDHIVLALYWRAGAPHFEQLVAEYVEQSAQRALINGWDFDVPRWLPPVMRHSSIIVRLASRLSSLHRMLKDTLSGPAADA
jgi:hypothetical protein